MCLTSCPPTFHVLHPCLHVPEAVDQMRPCFAVASVVFEFADVSELQVFVGSSFVLVVLGSSFVLVVRGPVLAVEV